MSVGHASPSAHRAKAIAWSHRNEWVCSPCSGGSSANSSPGTRYTVPGADSRRRRVDDDDPVCAPHPERGVHPGGATVHHLRPVRHPELPEMAHQNGSDAVVAAQQVAAADDQHLAAGRLEVDLVRG